jgi:hypothetical protein
MPDHILGDQFPQAPPIFIKDDLINAFFRQRTYREQEIALATKLISEHKDDAEAVEEILTVAFPQRFDQCYPSGFGKPCPYTRLCFGPQGLDPLQEGYNWRDEEHLAEYKKLAGIVDEVAIDEINDVPVL